jgi:hypothetical protein
MKLLNMKMLKKLSLLETILLKVVWKYIAIKTPVDIENA